MYVFAMFIISSACIVIVFLMGSPVHLNPLCLIYLQTSSLKSKWFWCLCVLMNVSVIPVSYYSIRTVYSLTRETTALAKKYKNATPVFKMVSTLVVYLLICVSISIMEIVHVWRPLTDLGQLVVFIIIFPLHSLTNPWVVSIIPYLQLVLKKFQNATKQNRQ